MRRGHDEYPAAAADRDRVIRFWEFIAPSRGPGSFYDAVSFVKGRFPRFFPRTEKPASRGSRGTAIVTRHQVLPLNPDTGFAIQSGHPVCRGPLSGGQSFL